MKGSAMTKRLPIYLLTFFCAGALMAQAALYPRVDAPRELSIESPEVAECMVDVDDLLYEADQLLQVDRDLDLPVKQRHTILQQAYVLLMEVDRRLDSGRCGGAP